MYHCSFSKNDKEKVYNMHTHTHTDTNTGLKLVDAINMLHNFYRLATKYSGLTHE